MAKTLARAKADRAALRASRDLDGVTVSLNGGPHVGIAVVKDALAKVRGAAAREAAMGGEQIDLEEVTGVAKKQTEVEAEAGGTAADRLRSIVERIERLEEERKALAADVKDIFSEAKSAGFELKVLRRVIRDRKREPADVENEEDLLDLYKRALGMA